MKHTNWSLPPLVATRRNSRRAFIYCRVSSKRQAESNISLPVQANICQAYAEQNGYTLSSVESNVGLRGVWHDPGVSAYKIPLDMRKGFRAMWAHMDPGDVIIMLSLDRGWRSVHNFVLSYQEMATSKVEVCFANNGGSFGGESDSPMNRFLLTNEANIAQLKSELISARVRESYAERKAKALSLEGSPNACAAKMEYGETAAGRKVRPIQYEKQDQPVWGEAYRDIRDMREDLPPEKGRIYGYARVSTDEQSVEVQKSIISGHTRQFGVDTGRRVVNTFSDCGISAFKVPWSERPAGAILWNRLESGDHVFILSADRAFRSITDMAVSMQELEALGVTLHFIRDGIRTDQKGGLRLLQSLSLAAQWERDDMSDRISFSLESRRQEQGNWLGPQTARWIRDKREHGHRILMVDPEDIDRSILITQMIRNKGKTSWDKLVRNIEQECAKWDGRKPIPFAGASLAVYRRQCNDNQKHALNKYILRKRHSWAVTGFAAGKNGKKGKNSIQPEISIRWARDWEEKVWGKLLQYVAVKPDIFVGSREKILEVG